jgi:hypothetical protein
MHEMPHPFPDKLGFLPLIDKLKAAMPVYCTLSHIAYWKFKRQMLGSVTMTCSIQLICLL